MTSDEAVKLVQRVVAEAAMLADGTTAGVGELEEAREALIAALTAPAALKGQCTVAQFDHECAPGTCAMRNASGGEHDCERTAPAAGEDVELVAQMIHDAPSYYADDLEKRPWVPRGNSFKQQEARRLASQILSRLRAVPQGRRDIEKDPPPKDGTRFLGYCRLNYWVYSGKDQVRWTAHEPDWHVLRARTDTGEWVTSDGPNDITQGPTRWMPLPAAPAPEKGEG